MLELKKGLDNFQIKMLALILMVVDHIHYILGSQLGVPLWFTQLGRLSAPLFIYMTAQGMRHTRNPKKYVSRLYIAFVLMGIGNQLVNTYLPHPMGYPIINNIFGTLFLITFYIYMGKEIKANWLSKKTPQVFMNIIGMAIPILGSFLTLSAMNGGQIKLMQGLMLLLPTPLFVEGGFLMVIMGIGFYLVGTSKIKLSVFYSLFSLFLLYASSGGNFTYENLFLINFQWLMVFSLPIMLLYNQQKGKSMKAFFYIFYPAHIYILLLISILIGPVAMG